MTSCAPEDTREDDETDHLENVPDGSGCTEIWEYLSEQRERESTEDGDSEP